MTISTSSLPANKFPGTCGCGTAVAAGAGFRSARPVDGKWVVYCLPCAGAPVASPVQDRPALQLTEEQQRIVELFEAGADLAVEAGAGTGKTTTLIAIAASTKRSGSYIAFNRAIVAEASAKFAAQAPNVGCATVHSLAFRSVGRKFSHRLPKGGKGQRRLRSDEVARRLDIDPFFWTVTGSDGNESRKVLQPSALASYATQAIKKFCNSADLEPSARSHCKYVDGIDLADEDGRRTYANNDRLRAQLEPAVAKLWADLSDPAGQLPFQADVYLKLWALSENPVIPGEFILIDEAQDLSPVMTQILEKQSAQLVFVGDSQQAIYGWRGAVNALENVPADQTAFLTHSFRFGPEVADVANKILSQIASAKLRIVGRGKPGVLGPLPADVERHAILNRSNAGAIASVLGALATGKQPHLVGGGAEVEAFTKAAKSLQAGQGTDHPDLAGFDTWTEVQDYVENDPSGEDLKLLVNLIDKYGVDEVLRAVANSTPEARADVVVSTAHKAKGREWDYVVLGSDFNPNRTDDEELRLLYVAATRAKLHLDFTVCEPVRRLVAGERLGS
jgi:superfamily I DNA/RNA helicase